MGVGTGGLCTSLERCNLAKLPKTGVVPDMDLAAVRQSGRLPAAIASGLGGQASTAVDFARHNNGKEPGLTSAAF